MHDNMTAQQYEAMMQVLRETRNHERERVEIERQKLKLLESSLRVSAKHREIEILYGKS